VGVAWFELGCLYQARKANLAKAKECFDKAVATVKDPDMKDTRHEAKQGIETILKYGEGKMPGDTSKLAALSSPEFKVGELFWLELGEPDSAYRHYCATACDTHYRAMVPKALYAAAWIARFALKDSVHADSLYRLLLARFPSNAYSQKARSRAVRKLPCFTRQDSAKAAFEAAEKIFLDDENRIPRPRPTSACTGSFPIPNSGPRACMQRRGSTTMFLTKIEQRKDCTRSCATRSQNARTV